MPTAAQLEIALKSPLLSAVPEAAARGLIARSSVRRLVRGEALFAQNQPADSAFVVLEGWIKLYRVTASGEEAVVHVFSRGQSFAEAPAFDPQPYPVSAAAASDAAVLQLRGPVLREMLEADPAIARAMIAASYRHLHSLVTQIEQLKAQDAPQRVASFLLALCGAGEGPQTVGLPYEKGLIAARLGMSPQSLSRAFGQLRRRGVAVDGSEAEIADPAALRAYAGGGRAGD
ncbi:Crp/Fnr family transcriptional regulator [Rubrimonas sp.]|uniref:Crp/Fnr family transcriptional regulator n=1 Tax=Rubrimonas sp. TaxID=2036015 RepID=UPI002FDE0EB0